MPATPLDLLEHNCLTFQSRAAPVGWWSFAGVNRDKQLEICGNLRTDDVDFMVEAAIAGNGVVHLASWLISDAIATGQLVPLFKDYPHAKDVLSGGIHAVRLPGRSHPLKAKLFIEHLRAHFGTPPYWEHGEA